MTVRPRRLAVLLLMTGLSAPAWAQGPLHTLGQELGWVSADGAAWGQLSVTGELTAYAFEDPPPGLIFADDDTFLAPRLSLTADLGVGERLLAHALVRADRGFDPGDDEDGDVRLDEAFVQINLFDAARGRIRAGRFATVFGGWVGRHLAWDNPLISAPAVYDDMVAVTHTAAPPDRDGFAGRRDNPENKDTWVPVVWGPSYATGAAVSGGAGTFDLAVELKNTALSAPPTAWDDGFDTDPTVSARAGWHPTPEWTLGASFSSGPYLRDAAQPTLPAGADVDDFAQTTWGFDLTYERRHLQLWAELVGSRFEVPRVGDVDMLGGFVELRYKPAPRLWTAVRLNHSRFDDTPGLDQPWDRHLSRVDLGIGYRHSAHVQAKLEYAYGDQAGRDSNGNHLLAAQIMLWF